MNERECCSACGTDLVGGDIPYDIVHHYMPLGADKDQWLSENEWPTWKRKVGIEVPGVYDGTLIWECPDCKYQWPRFREGDPRHQKALDIIERRKVNAGKA